MTVKSERDLARLREIGRIVAQTIEHMAAHLQPGMTTRHLDEIGAKFLKEHGARSAPILAYNFPGHTCISVNDEAAHGIPSDREILLGDLVNIDVSAEKNGFWADAGASYPVGPVTPVKQRLLDTTREALTIALKQARAGNRIYMVGKAVEAFAHDQGYEILEQLGGHGVGRSIHEPPHIPNHYDRNDRNARQRFTEGLVVTIEPFLTTGGRFVHTLDDGWTLKTHDSALVAQFEHTIVITRTDPILITAL